MQEWGTQGLRLVSDPLFPIGILSNMAHVLLEGRAADGLVQISGQIPMQLAEANMNLIYCSCIQQCIQLQNPMEPD